MFTSVCLPDTSRETTLSSILTQRFPRLLVICFCDLLHFHGVVNDQVHELVEPLRLSLARDSESNDMLALLTRIFPSMRIDSCSYSQTLTVAF